MPRIALSLGKFFNNKSCPNSSIESRWTNARRRTLEPQAQVARSVAKSSTWLAAPQILQVNEIMLFDMVQASRAATIHFVQAPIGRMLKEIGCAIIGRVYQDIAHVTSAQLLGGGAP